MWKMGHEAEWCPICGCYQDGNGVWYIPEGVRTYSVSDAGEVVVCEEHTKSEYWGKTERECLNLGIIKEF